MLETRTATSLDHEIAGQLDGAHRMEVQYYDTDA